MADRANERLGAARLRPGEYAEPPPRGTAGVQVDGRPHRLDDCDRIELTGVARDADDGHPVSRAIGTRELQPPSDGLLSRPPGARRSLVDDRHACPGVDGVVERPTTNDRDRQRVEEAGVDGEESHTRDLRGTAARL